jgi:hypothetical protein
MKEKTHALESEQSSVFSGDLLYDVLAMNFLIFFLEPEFCCLSNNNFFNCWVFFVLFSLSLITKFYGWHNSIEHQIK